MKYLLRADYLIGYEDFCYVENDRELARENQRIAEIAQMLQEELPNFKISTIYDRYDNAVDDCLAIVVELSSLEELNDFVCALRDADFSIHTMIKQSCDFRTLPYEIYMFNGWLD